MIAALLAALGCRPATDGPTPVNRAEARTVLLSSLPFAELSLPPDNHGGVELPPRVPITGPWRKLATNARGRTRFSTPLPVSPRGLFFERPEPGMQLLSGEGPVRYHASGGSEGLAWSHDRDALYLFVPAGTSPPTGLQLEWPTAADRERALNQAWSGKPSAEFAWTTVQDDWDSRRGLLLPAPARAAWDVAIPPAAELRFASGLLEPELRVGSPSDGAVLRVSADGVELASDALVPGEFHDRRIPLDHLAGHVVRLAVETSPGAASTGDYAFLAAPVVASRQQKPRRVVMVFIDTLRPDHLSLYGYRRDTSAAIDHLATEAALFTNARSVAPWTLPAARSIATGRYPEYYGAATTLPALLREEGFATGFLAGNVYLSTTFEMNRDWDFHRVAMLPPATQTTDEAIAWLDAAEGRDALLQVHYMSAHLPYLDPPSYRTRYASAGEAGLGGEIQLADVRRVDLAHNPAGQRYLVDRYDGAVRWTTDEVQRLLAHLAPDDIVLLYSDHGEEFWDHGAFEHGHTLYDELLRVPLVIRAPGVRAARIDTPVSLLDLAPTVLDLLGVPVPAGLDGASLLPLLSGGAMAPRDLAFGHPLYGPERWGLVHGVEKWTNLRDHESVTDLAADPRERRGSPPTDPLVWHERLAHALQRTVGHGWRLVPTPDQTNADPPGLAVRCTVPGGFSAAFPVDDPLGGSAAAARLIPGGAEVCWSPGWSGARDVHLIPARPRADVEGELRCEASYGAARAALDRAQSSVNLGGRHLTLQASTSPVPDARTSPLEGSDAEVAGMLAALGYLTGEGSDEGPLPCQPQ